MKEKFKQWIETGKDAFKVYSDNDMTVYAGYATVYILSAALPMLMLIIAAVGMMPGFSADNLEETITQLMPELPQVQDLLLSVIDNVKSQSSGLLASVAALTTLWSASGGISALQKGLIKITPGSESNKTDKIRALIFTVLFTIMFLSILVFQVLGGSIRKIILSLVGQLNMPEVYSIASKVLQVSSLLTLALTVAILLLAYTYLPGGKRSAKKQLPGAVFTTVAWVVFSMAFAFFIPRFWSASALYGSLAAIFLVTLWLRLCLTILFIGGSLNVALTDETAATSSASEDGTETADK